MFQALDLDLYLSTAPAPALVAYAVLGIIAFGFVTFLPGLVVDHVAAARGSR